MKVNIKKISLNTSADLHRQHETASAAFYFNVYMRKRITKKIKIKLEILNVDCQV